MPPQRRGQLGTPAPRQVTWSVAAGHESFWMRDISRSGTPVDASPIAWTGDGPAVVVYSGRWRPVRMIPASIADSATQAAGTYE